MAAPHAWLALALLIMASLSVLGGVARAETANSPPGPGAEPFLCRAEGERDARGARTRR